MQHSRPSDPNPDQNFARSARPQQSDGPTVSFGRGRIRLRIALAFLLPAVVPGVAGGAPRMLLFGLTLFSVVVLHELAHALAALAFGSRATIVVRVWGGNVEIDPPLRGWRAIVTALAGPIVSLAIGLACRKASAALADPAWLRFAALANLGWGGVNLLPFVPFDLGR